MGLDQGLERTNEIVTTSEWIKRMIICRDEPLTRYREAIEEGKSSQEAYQLSNEVAYNVYAQNQTESEELLSWRKNYELSHYMYTLLPKEDEAVMGQWGDLILALSKSDLEILIEKIKKELLNPLSEFPLRYQKEMSPEEWEEEYRPKWEETLNGLVEVLKTTDFERQTLLYTQSS